MSAFSPGDMQRIQDTIRARLVLQRESIADQQKQLRAFIVDGIHAGLTTADLAERSGLTTAEVEEMRP